MLMDHHLKVTALVKMLDIRFICLLERGFLLIPRSAPLVKVRLNALLVRLLYIIAC